VTRQAYWQIKMDKFEVEGKNVSACDATDAGCQVIVDSGTSLLAVPSHLAEAINHAIGKLNGLIKIYQFSKNNRKVNLKFNFNFRCIFINGGIHWNF